MARLSHCERLERELHYIRGVLANVAAQAQLARRNGTPLPDEWRDYLASAVLALESNRRLGFRPTGPGARHRARRAQAQRQQAAAESDGV